MMVDLSQIALLEQYSKLQRNLSEKYSNFFFRGKLSQPVQTSPCIPKATSDKQCPVNIVFESETFSK